MNETITKAQLMLACAATVEAWDMETLIGYAVDRMYESAQKYPYAIVGESGEEDGLYLQDSADTSAEANDIVDADADFFNGGFKVVRIDD